MEKDDVRFRKLLPGLFWNADVVILVEGSANKSDFVAIDDFEQLLSCPDEVSWVTLAALESDLDSVVALEELDLILWIATFFYLLEKMLAVQPHHLHRIQLHRHFPIPFLRHTNYYLDYN